MIQTQNQKTVAITPPGALVDNAGFTTASIDTKGFGYLDIYILLGATDIAMAALKVQTSDTDSAYADLDGADFSVAPATLPDADADNKVLHVGIDLRGKKRFFDVVATAGDGSTGTYMAVWAVLSRAEQAPDTATERGFAQELLV
jgi:hypothetical protein